MRPVSRAELSRIAGVSGAAITKACGKQLAPACRSDRVDLDHPAVVAYLARKGRSAPPPDRAPTAAAKRHPKRKPLPTRTSKRGAKRAPPPTASSPSEPPAQPRGTRDELEAYAFILRPLLDRFGTARGFRDWLLSLKELEVIRAKMLENEETEGRLISRELVRTHVMGSIEASNRRLLTDAPKTIARRAYAAKTANVPVEEAETMVRDVITSTLKPAHATAAKLLRDPADDAPV